MLNKIVNFFKADKNLYLLACCFYFLNSFSNVFQGVLTKFVTQNNFDFTFYQFLTLRCFVGCLVLLPFSIKNIIKQKKTIHINLVIAFLSAMDIVLWNSGLKTVPVNNGILIAFLVPIWSVILAKIILKEKDFTVYHLISFILCFFAIFLLIRNNLKFTSFNKGYLFIFINTINIPLSLILQKKWRNSRPIFYGIFSNFLICFLLCFALSDFNFPVITKKLLISASIIAFFDIIEYFSVYMAYRLYPIASLQPIRFTRIVISGILSYLFLSETITLNQFISITIIIFANMIIPFKDIIYLKFKKNV